MNTIIARARAFIRRALRSGQFTSPGKVVFRYGLGYAIGVIENDSNTVKAVIRIYSKAGVQTNTYEIDLEGVDEKAEGPGLGLIAVETEDGYDLDFVVTAHANAYNTDNSRDNFIASGTIERIVSLPDVGDFIDVPRTDWAYAPVRAMARRGILSGYGAGDFRPGASVTRAQLCKILFMLLGLGGR